MGQFDNFFADVSGEKDEGLFPVVPGTTPAREMDVPPPVGFVLPDSIFDEARSDEANRINGALYQIKDVVPNAYAESSDLAKKLGLPVDLVRRNKDELAVQARLEAFHSILDVDPRLKNWALDNPDQLPKVEPDELQKLSGIDWMGQSFGQAWQSGEEDAQKNYLRYLEVLGKSNPALRARADYLSHKWRGRSFGAEGWWQKSMVGAAQMVPEMGHSIYGFPTFESMKAGIGGAGVGAGGALILGQIGPQIGTPEEIITVPGGAMIGFAYGQNAIQQIGASYDAFLDIRDESGNPIDADTAKMAAIISGGVGAILDTASIGKLLGKVPGADRLMGIMERGAMKDALHSKAVRKALSNAAKHVFGSGAFELSTEVAQQAIQITAEELSKAMADGSFEQRSAMQWSQELVDTAVQTAQVMSILGPLSASPALLSDFRAARRAGKVKEFVEGINKEAAADKLVKRDPSTAASVVDSLAKDGPITEIHVPSERLVELLQDEGIDVYEFGKNIPDWSNRLNEAIVAGGDVTMTIGEYYANVAPTKVSAKFADVVRINYLDPIPVDVQKLNDDLGEAVVKAISEPVESKPVDVKQERSSVSPEQAVYDAVLNAAKQSGIIDNIAKEYGTLYKEFFKTMGDRAGLNPKELFDKYGLTITQPDVMETLKGETFNQNSKVISREDNPRAYVDYERETNPEKKRLLRYPGAVSFNKRGDPIDLQGKRVKDRIDVPKVPRYAKDADGNLTEDNKGNYVILNKKERRKIRDKARKARIIKEGGTPLKQEYSGIPDERVTEKEDEYLFVNLSDEQLLNLEEFLNPDEFSQGKRGSITFNSGSTAIRLFRTQNLSTFLHESGHFFFKVFQDLASAENVPQQIKDDWAALEKHMDFSGKPTVEAHEKFAKAFEAYLREGKAPTYLLQQVFHRFRSWLLAVYRSATALGGVPNGEVKDVFDRMLASDWAIQVVQRDAEFKPAFNDPALLTPDEWTKYNALVEKHVSLSRDKLQSILISEAAAKLRGDMAVAKKELKKNIREQLAKSPLYTTIERMRKGTEFTNPIRLDEDELKRIYGPEIVAKMPTGTVGGSVTMHPDEMAELMGWPSGDVMVSSLAASKPLNVAVNEEVNAQFQAEFGDKFKNSEMLVSEARQAMHSDQLTSILELEIKALNKRAGRGQLKAPSDYTKHLAQEKVNSQKIKDVSKFARYVAAEREAAKRSEKALSEGRYADAAEYKRQQLYSHEMGKVAAKAIKDVEKMRTYAVRIIKGKKSIDPEYNDQIKALLDRFEFAKVDRNELMKRENLLSFIQKEEAKGNVVAIPQYLLDEAKKFNYAELTVDEFLGLRDAVKNIEHLGKLKHSIIIKRQKVEFEKASGELSASILEHNTRRKESKNVSPTRMELYKENLSGLDSAFLKIEQIVQWLDGGDINGPARKYLFQPIADAEVIRNDMLADYTAKLANIFEGIDTSRMSDRVHVPEVGKVFTIADVYGVALNMGNHENYDKMKRGEGKAAGGKAWTDADVEAIVKHLTKEDWDRVQGMWDVINSLWPQINKLQRKISGVYPKKVPPRVVTTPYGEYKGGYYPIVYDKRRATDVSARETIQAEMLFPDTYIMPTTAHGHTKERSKGYSAPMSYDLMAAANHLNAVIHDLTHREAVRDVYKMVSSEEVANALRATLGDKYREEFPLWLKFIASERNAGEQDINSLNKFIKKMRTNATMVGIGLRVTTMLAQFTGFSQAQEMLKPGSLVKGIRMSLANPVEASRFVNKLSGEMRHRSDQLDRDVREGILALKDFTKKASQVKRFAYYGIAMADRMVTVPTWLGAYHEHLEAHPQDEQGAIANADRVVRLSQGSGAIKDMARVQRGSEFQKLFTMFYSYFSALYSRSRNLTRDIRRASVQDVPHLAARALFLIAVPAVMGELLTGRGPDDDESWSKWAVKRMLLYPFMAVPGLRDAVSVLDSGHYTATPVARAIDTFKRLAGDIGDLAVEGYEGGIGEDAVRKFVRHSLESTGYVFGLPTGQIALTVDNIWKGLDEGNLTPRDLVFARKP